MNDNQYSDDLRRMIEYDTGVDPASEAGFEWSTSEQCERCGRVRSTARVSFDGEKFVRVCSLCYLDYDAEVDAMVEDFSEAVERLADRFEVSSDPRMSGTAAEAVF